MADIKDFGEKIGGARKDMWRSRGMIVSDLSELTDVERIDYIKKDNVWPRPDWEKLIAEGTPQTVAYWQNEMRKSIPPRPVSSSVEAQNNYVEVVGEIKQAVMNVKKAYEIDSFYNNFIYPNYLSSAGGRYVNVSATAQGIITNKIIRTSQKSQHYMQKEAEKALFGIPDSLKVYTSTKNSLSVHKYDDDYVYFDKDNLSSYSNRMCMIIESNTGKSFYYLYEKDKFFDINEWEKGSYFIIDQKQRKPLKINFSSREEAEAYVETYAKDAQKLNDTLVKEIGTGKTSNRKGAFVPPQLQHVKRDGPNYRGIKPASGDMYLEDLKFRAGEFGNWMDVNDRQTSLNMGYDALRDLARLLNIKPEDVSLGGKLAIAFGARGRGGANAGAAHYEPARQVINLTKMAGAGCLAHEWAHALDHSIGLAGGQTRMASELNKRFTSEVFYNLIGSLKYKTVMVEPEQLNKEIDSKIKHAKRGLMNWIDSEKPKNLSEERQKVWDQVVEAIISKSPEITGYEYQTLSRFYEPSPVPEIELLSQIRKEATKHVIPKDDKIQITLWASDLGNAMKTKEDLQPSERKVETDFYKGSKEFDKMYSKSSHGYWSSSCEMFARAFDCYIADKIKESGCSSDYLSAHADSFVISNGQGGKIAAVPLGEEREVINKNFDLLIEDLKERGILHDYVEPVIDVQTPDKVESFIEVKNTVVKDDPFEDFPQFSEQLSLDDLLFNATTRFNEMSHSRKNNTPERSR